jgi:hypothetical protein
MGVSIIILLPPNLLAQIWEVSWDLCRWHCAHKWCHGAVVEALTQHGMPPHPLQTYIYKVIDCGWEYGGVIMLYYQTCWPRFGKSIELCHLCAHNWWLMPWHSSNWGAKPSWNGSHIHSKHIPETRRWLTTFICCGWEYGSIIMPLPPHLLAKISLVSGNYGSLLDGKWCRGAVVEALLKKNRLLVMPTPASSCPKSMII